MTVENAAHPIPRGDFGKHGIHHLAIRLASRLAVGGAAAIEGLQAAHVGAKLLHPQLDKRIRDEDEYDVGLLDVGFRTGAQMRPKHHAQPHARQAADVRHAFPFLQRSPFPPGDFTRNSAAPPRRRRAALARPIAPG